MLAKMRHTSGTTRDAPVVANRRRPIWAAPIRPARIASGWKSLLHPCLRTVSLSEVCTTRINAIALTKDSAAAELRYIETLCFLHVGWNNIYLRQYETIKPTETVREIGRFVVVNPSPSAQPQSISYPLREAPFMLKC